MKKIKYIILIILGIIILLSSCSLFPSEVERHLFFDSICWEDDSHILMYTMVRKWVNTSWMSWGSETGYWDWSQGEIWRINVFTGEKELLLRREGDYYTGLSTPIKIDVLGDRKLISLDGNAYIMEGESADWQEIPGIYEAEWVNDNEIIGISEEAQALVKYNLQSETITNEYFTVVTEDKRNYLSYDPISNDCMITTNFSSLVIFENMNFQEKLVIKEDTFIDADSNLFVCDWYNEPFCLNDNSRVVQIDGYDLYKSEYHSYLLELDSNNKFKSLINIDDEYMIPNNTLDCFIIPIYKQEYVENGLQIYNKELEVISTTLFPLDRLD